MKRIATLLAAAGLCLAAHTAQAAQPTPQSIERLLALTNSDKMLEAMRPQINAMMKAGIAQATAGNPPGPEEQAIIDRFTNRVSAAMAEEMTMEKFKPMMIEVYTANFSQEEIDGITAFYDSPVGRSMLSKMPAVMQSMMAGMPKRMAPMIDRLQQASREMAAELAELRKKRSGN